MEERIAKAFRLVLCRKPGEKELNLLQAYFRDEKKYFDAESEKATGKLKVGEYKQDKTGDVAGTAALMQVVATLYNMDEAITK